MTNVRLTYHDGTQGDVVYREADLFGAPSTAAIPEPTSLGLLGVGGVIILQRKRVLG